MQAPDAIGMYEGEEAIIDFKRPRKIKKTRVDRRLLLQGCAYALAHNEMFGSDNFTSCYFNG